MEGKKVEESGKKGKGKEGSEKEEIDGDGHLEPDVELRLVTQPSSTSS